jgi:hypothetical protein
MLFSVNSDSETPLQRDSQVDCWLLERSRVYIAELWEQDLKEFAPLVVVGQRY